MNQHKKYISSLKGIACVLVMLGHFLGIIKYSSDIAIDISFFETLDKLRLSFILNESFWLKLFFVVSGYLCAHSQIKGWLELVKKTIYRFLRLALPIFGANIIIFIVAKTIGFYNSETSVLFQNSWFQSAYMTELDIGLLLRSPFDILLFSNCYFNSPFWVLKDMFIASIGIYLFSLLKSKLKLEIYQILLCVLFLVSGYFISSIVFVCFFGMAIALCEDAISGYITLPVTIGTFIASLILCLIIPNIATIPLFSWSIICIPKYNRINKFFEGKVFNYIGKISFGIYSLHWPVLCSIGSVLILKYQETLGLGNVLLVSMTFCFVFTILLAIIFNETVEKYSTIIIKKVQNRIERGLEAND